jgi:hypothetical protein
MAPRGRTEASSQSFVTREEAARRLGLSLNGFALACERGEVAGLVRMGRSVRIYWPAVILASLGADVCSLCRELGIDDLETLAGFLDAKR